MTGTVSVRGTDDAARRMARQTLKRLVAEAEKGRRPSSVISLGHVIDEWLRVAEHDDSTPRGLHRAHDQTGSRFKCRLRSSTTSSWTASAAST